MKKNHMIRLVLSALFLAIGFVLPFLTGQIPEVGSLLPLDPASPVGAALGFLSSPAILVVQAGVTGWMLSLLRPGKEGGEAR